MATRTALKIAAAGSAVVLLATASAAPAQGPPPPGPQSTTVTLGLNADGIVARTPDGRCTDPESVQLADGPFWAVSCGYNISTTDNKLFFDREVCVYDGTHWIFKALVRTTTSGYSSAQRGRSYLDPSRVDVGAPCIL